ncbi:MAG: PEP-CTERM/exosortase system-associated acyltransferase [Geobacteraceae bacterium]|nr:PEP-CTERM/exosortase system-associated acyltransferase [Geobacteraceae bacterium]
MQTFSPQLPRKTSIPIFNDWFDIVQAETPELLDQAFRLRYQVYCRERGYEESAAFTDQRETDSFDNHSVHSLIVSRVDDSILGTVRLVLAGNDASTPIFPMHQICRNFRIAHMRPLCLSKTAEISRFAISKVARKYLTISASQDGFRVKKPGENTRLARPSIVLGLMKAILQMSLERGITDWLAVMDPSLLRLLARFGIYFQPVGPLVAYHGMRQPCYGNIQFLLKRIRKEQPDIWAFITDEGYFSPSP